MKRISVITCLFAGIVSQNSALAAPDQTTRYLINQEISLLTWGMYRIDQALNERFASRNLSSRTTYNYGRDTITIGLSNGFSDSELVPTKRNCKEIVNETRRASGINPETGQPSNGSNSFFITYFGQTGYSAKSRPNHIGDGLDRKIRIDVSLGPTDSNMETINCQGALLSRQVLFPE